MAFFTRVAGVAARVLGLVHRKAVRRPMIRMIRRASGLLILTGVLAGCGLLSSSPTPTPLPTRPPTPETAPPSPEATLFVDDTGAEVATVEPGAELTETYRNSVAGYAFDYPSAWLVDGEGEYVSLQNYNSEELPPREVDDPDLYKIEFVWIRPGQAQTVDEMLDQMHEGLDASPTDITVNGLAGVQVRMRGFAGDASDVLLLDLNGRVLLIQSWQGGPLFDRVTATVRPIETDN